MNKATRNQPITLILAATFPALGIGKNGTLPWRLKREMKYFKQVTDGGVVVMGRKTWDSIPPKFRPLSNRTNVVVTRNNHLNYEDGVVVSSSIEHAIHNIDKSKPIFIIGGAQIYQTCLPYANRILLTQIDDPDGSIECDAFFELDWDQWTQQSADRLKDVVGPNVDLPEGAKVSENDYNYTFTLWEKNS